MRKIILSILSILLLASSALAADYSVTRMASQCVVGENGAYIVGQTVELSLSQPQRSLTVPVGVDVRSVEVASQGAEAEIRQEAGNTYATLTFPQEVQGDITVKITFVKDGVLTAEDGKQHYACELVSSLWEQKVERFSFSVSMPRELPQEPVFLSGYRNEDVMDTLETASVGSAVSGQLRGGLLDRESFTLTLTAPKGYFTPEGFTPPSVGLWIIFGLMVILFGLGVYYWFRFLRAPRLKVQARTTPPESITPAELPFILCGGKISFGLLVCHWASLGYLTVQVNSAGRIQLRKNMDMGSERREEEKKLFQILFGASDVCEGGGSRYERAAILAQKALSRHWYRRIFQQESGSVRILWGIATIMCALAALASMHLLLESGKLKVLILILAFFAGGAMGTAVYWGIIRATVRDRDAMLVAALSFAALYLLAALGGGLGLMLFALAAAVLAGFATRRGGKRTPTGTDFVERSMGYCRFLHHAEERHLRQMLERDSQFFYSAMLYAYACGVGRRFARSFSDTRLEECPWLRFSARTSSYAYPFYLRFESLVKKLDG